MSFHFEPHLFSQWLLNRNSIPKLQPEIDQNIIFQKYQTQKSEKSSKVEFWHCLAMFYQGKDYDHVAQEGVSREAPATYLFAFNLRIHLGLVVGNLMEFAWRDLKNGCCNCHSCQSFYSCNYLSIDAVR